MDFGVWATNHYNEVIDCDLNEAIFGGCWIKNKVRNIFFPSIAIQNCANDEQSVSMCVPLLP